MSSSTADERLAGVEDRLAVRVIRAVVTQNHLTVELEDGRTLSVPLTWYPRLMHGSPAERANIEISGLGIHWPDLDEDISVRGLLLGHRSGESPKSLQRWLEYRSRGEKVPVPTFPLPEDMRRDMEEEQRARAE